MSADRDSASEAGADLLEAGSRLGLSVLNLLVHGATAIVAGAPGLAPQRGHGRGCRCGCRIPPPCWEPRALGTYTSHACPGADATLRIRVTNCGSAPRTVNLEPGAGSSAVEFDPPTLGLGPEERGYSVVSFDIPPDAEPGDGYEFLVWITGCKQYFLRWRIRVGRRCGDSCPQVEVDDCPDLLHHWYDHFYCVHPCPPHHPTH